MEEDHPIKLLQVSKNNLKSVLCLRCAPRAFAGDLFYKTPSFFFSLSAPILIPPVFSGLLSTSYRIQDFSCFACNKNKNSVLLHKAKETEVSLVFIARELGSGKEE